MYSLVVREISESDEQEILSIRNDPLNYKWFFSNSPVLANVHREWFSNRLLDSRFFTLAAESDSQVVGVAYLTTISDYSARVSIVVRNESGNRGVGTRLLNELKHRSKQRGIMSLTAEVLKSNTASINFFLKNGFITESSQQKSSEKIDENVVLLLFNLNSW